LRAETVGTAPMLVLIEFGAKEIPEGSSFGLSSCPSAGLIAEVKR
jgi:hypothetical protein